uniref:hypothetical chloroplast RF1 n=1 Tax=Coelastrum microporum TaxID=55409 RepID=UPI00226CCC2E|nr:hypothetical chloroplast RF1 [Coelastrum microporum]UWM13115.1 hypothetical chloroplast RF1 [Coelastrum microporum]
MFTFTFMSLVTSIKDYVEVVHKFVETDPNMKITTYYDFGSILTFIILSGKEVFTNVLTFQWFQKLWSIPTLIPDVASAMISEISVFDGYLKNTQTFFENPISYGNNNFFIYCSEKFIIGLLNSIFLCLPTSLAHIITLRRFVMQGLEAGFISGLGTIAGNIVWIGSIIFGFRFLVIPWLSLDLFRYFLGFILIVKYMWDSYTERRMVLEDLSKYKIFLLTFLLSFTEQTTIYPFLSNLAIGSDSTILESFPTNNFYEFGIIHCCYLLGILIGSLSLLQFTCWFWENPAFQIYMWFISSFKTTTNVYSKLVNLGFLYLTMICAISNISYFGLDYTLTKPLGFVHEDRLLDQKALLETAFLNTKASDRNTRRNRGRHGRRERWKRRVRRYRTFDASLYDQGIYDLLTIEDLNYGFDRFWLRRKIRNHRVRFRFFPGPWMRSFKKQLSRPRLESFMGPRVEFFRILFEQAYHPEFHEFSKKKNILKSPATGRDFVKKNSTLSANQTTQDSRFSNIENMNSIYWNIVGNKQQRISKQKSTLRKFVRKMNTRIKVAKIKNQMKTPQNFESAFENVQNGTAPLFSKSWKSFSKIENSKLQESIYQKSPDNSLFQRFYNTIFLKNEKNSVSTLTESKNSANGKEKNKISVGSEVPINKKNAVQKNFSKKERFLERYKTFLTEKTEIQEKQNFSKKIGKNADRVVVFPSTSNIEFLEQSFDDEKTNKEESSNISFKSQKANKDEMNFRTVQNNSHYRSMTLLHPLKFYFQKEQALKKKFQFYGVKLFRNFGVENNAPYFRVMMKRFFYHYKPSLRWERTLRVATMRRARRKNSRIPRKLNISKTSQMYASGAINENNSFENGFSNVNPSSITKPTHFYSLVDKRASRYRYQIYKDVLQHWYYNPLNRFLLKVDVDSFIRRQPNSYFLTKNDEKLLHLKRQLLSEYYETLRWYTYMQHYSTMKHQIGGTKSLSSRAYNQQFVGTFKKIRHLFNITPSFQDNTVLKFDQPLYNEYNNTKTSQIFNTSIIHEELLADDLLFSEKTQNANTQNLTDSRLQTLPEDLTNQSAKILREYLTVASPLRQQYIQDLLVEKNYWELTKFLFKGQKIRGTNPITNETEFFNQEKQYLLENNTPNSSFETNQFKQEIWITLLQKCRNKLYDQEALKNYVSLKKEKYEIQKQRHQKYLKNRFQRMKESLQTNVFPNFEKQNSSNTVFEFEKFSGYPSALQKAMKESILWEKNSRASSSFQTVGKFFVKKKMLQKTNIRQNRPNLYSTMQPPDISFSASRSSEASKVNFQKTRATLFQQSFKNSLKKRIVEIYEAEKNFQQKFETRKKKKETQKTDFSKSATPAKQSYTLLQPVNRIKQFVWNILRFQNPFQQNNQTNIEKVPTLFQNVVSKMSFFVENPQKNIEFWKKRENALSKRRKIRKTLKRLRNQNTATAKIVFENTDFSIPFDKMQNSPSRQKNDQLEETRKTHENNFFKKQQSSRGQSWKKYSSFENDSNRQNNEFSLQNESSDSQKKKTSVLKNVFSFQKDFFTKKFQRKRSRLRRYSSFKGRGPIKKRTLREKLKRQFKSLKKYGASRENIASDQLKLEREKKKVELIQFITQRNYEANGEFLKKDQKQRRTRQMKHRVWKKKKQNFAQKRRKLRKRRRSTITKIRVFNKKLQRILAKKQIQTWWWQTFFPKFQKTAEKTWQVEKNKQIQKQLFDLSEKEILERDQLFSKNSNSLPNTQNAFFTNTIPSLQPLQNIKAIEKNSSLVLQIGDKDYKPLAIPEAFRIREKLLQKEMLRFEDPSMNKKEQTLQTPSTSNQQNTTIVESLSTTSPYNESANSFSLLEKLTQNVTTNENNRFSNNTNSSKFLVGTNPIPFYAGWDDSLRKFVITNRLLSRKECFSCSPQFQKLFFEKSPVLPSAKSFSNDFPTQASDFSKAPLQGMNAATTLYWQIPFTTYDPDQFFALGMDGFSPLGWRNFSMKHSKQTTKPMLVKNFFSFHHTSDTKNLSKNLQLKIFETALKTKFISPNSDSFNCQNPQNCGNINQFEKNNNILFSKNQISSKNEIDKNFEYRRILKKQKRIKKHPRPPVWFPSGSLAQQVLPVHYIYVFYKRSRLPRDRYIRRRLRSNFDKLQNRSGPTALFTKITDFTLRKRAKPRRKYHRKRFVLENNQFLLTRRKFRGFSDEQETNRPSSKLFQTTSRSSTKPEKRIVQSKQRKKITDSKQSSENLRVRQLRRRVQRQVYRPVSRYYPRSGGFVWPGDYLRLELVKAPQLNIPNLSTMTSEKSSPASELPSSRKIRKKKRRTLQEWQIQPKKYLLEKHNFKVLQKRYTKSGNIQL